MLDELTRRAKSGLDAISPPRSDLARVERRAQVLRVRRNVAGLIVGAIAVVGLVVPLSALVNLGDDARRPSDTNRTAVDAPRLEFEPAPGWFVASTGADATAAGVQAWASNVPFADDERPDAEDRSGSIGWPDATERALPPDGVLLVATYPLETRNAVPPTRSFPERALPLTIDDPPSTFYEGQGPDRALSIVNATVNGRYVNVRIVFGTGDPSPDSIRTAEEALGRLIVAPPPHPTAELWDFGIRMQVPDGWNGILFRWQVGEPVLHASSVPITDLYDGSSARDALTANDAFVVLSESFAAAAHYERVELPIEVRREDICPTCEILDNGTSPPPDHTLFYRAFAVGGRQFQLFVELGTADPTDERIGAINEILRTLAIDPDGTVPPEPPPARSFAPISIELPDGWTAKRSPVPGSAVVSAYGTWDFPTGGTCGPEPALADLRPGAALVWIVEHTDPRNAGDFIDPWRGYSMDLQVPPARWDCASASPSREELFRMSGRFFEVHIALGPGATSRTVAQVNTLIRSIRAETGG